MALADDLVRVLHVRLRGDPEDGGARPRIVRRYGRARRVGLAHGRQVSLLLRAPQVAPAGTGTVVTADAPADQRRRSPPRRRSASCAAWRGRR